MDEYEPIITLFLAGRMPRMNHARHLAIANIMRCLPQGRELMHLGIQITAIRAGKAEKYSREITDYYWDRLEGTLPPLSDFGDLLSAWVTNRQSEACDRRGAGSPACGRAVTGA